MGIQGRVVLVHVARIHLQHPPAEYYFLYTESSPSGAWGNAML